VIFHHGRSGAIFSHRRAGKRNECAFGDKNVANVPRAPLKYGRLRRLAWGLLKEPSR